MSPPRLWGTRIKPLPGCSPTSLPVHGGAHPAPGLRGTPGQIPPYPSSILTGTLPGGIPERFRPGERSRVLPLGKPNLLCNFIVLQSRYRGTNLGRETEPRIQPRSSPIPAQPAIRSRDLQGYTQTAAGLSPHHHHHHRRSGGRGGSLGAAGAGRLTRHRPSTPPLPPRYLIITLVRSCCHT